MLHKNTCLTTHETSTATLIAHKTSIETDQHGTTLPYFPIEHKPKARVAAELKKSLQLPAAPVAAAAAA
jgi:hypothetical protein